MASGSGGTSTLPTPLAADFVAYIQKVYQMAQGYLGGQGGTAAANLHTMQWLRHRDYGSFAFQVLLGPMDDKFLSYADQQAGTLGITTTTMPYFQDPMWAVPVKVSHLFAAMNAVFIKGSPPLPGTEDVLPPQTDAGDVAGWGGDWITYFADWRNAVAKYPDGEAYCRATLASATVQTHFMLHDLIEDADGYNIAMAMRADNLLALPDAIAQNYVGTPPPAGVGGAAENLSYKTRLHDFYAARFGGNTVSTVAVAASMLLSTDDLVIMAGRTRLIYGILSADIILPAQLPVSTLRGFCRGLDDVLQSLIAQEKTKAAASP